MPLNVISGKKNTERVYFVTIDDIYCLLEPILRGADIKVHALLYFNNAAASWHVMYG